MRADRVVRVLVTVATIVAFGVTAQGGAGATEQERITIAETDEVERDYPPIPGNETYATEKTVGTGAVSPPTPDDCRTASFACDVIPVTIEAPETPGAEYFVRFTLTWEAEPDPSGLTALQSNDLDMFLWHDPPREMSATANQDDPSTEEDETEEFHPGAEFRLPEVINFFSTEPGDFLLLVANGIGQNIGYTLTVQYFPSDAAPPLGFGGVVDPRPTVPVGSPTAAPAAVEPATPVTAFETPAPPALTIEPVGEDEDFDAFGSLDLDEELAAPADVSRFQPQSRVVAAAESPSSAALVIWMVLVPLAIGAALAVWLLRRRPSVLRLS